MKHVGQRVLLLQPAQEVDDLRLHRHVEGTRRLVQHVELRVQRQCARNGDALPLPAENSCG